MLANLAGAQEKTTVPADVGFAADVAAADFRGNGGAMRVKRKEKVELHGVGDLQPVFPEGPPIGIGFVGEDDVADFKDGFAAGFVRGELFGSAANLGIVAAFALAFKPGRIEAVDGKDDVVEVPRANLFGSEAAEYCAVGI